VQTGPALRGDEETIVKHMEFLKADNSFSEIYRVLTEDIQRLSAGMVHRQ